LKYIFHICPNYLESPLYHNLLVELENNDVKNIVYVPFYEVKKDVRYKIDYLKKSFGKIDRLLFYRKQNIIYKDILEKDYLTEINTIHAHTLFSSGYAAYRISKNINKKYIVAIRDTDVNIFFKYMIHLRKLGVKIMRNAEKIIFLSAAYKFDVISKYVPKLLKEEICTKSIVIPNGVDNYFLINKYHKEKKKNSNILKFLYIGQLSKRKNIKTTIKACKIIIDMGYKINYIIVGEKKIFNIDYWLKKYSFITYYKKCKKEQVLQYMRDADIFVMPSITETFGLVYPEAMSQGLPVIYSKGQGFDGYFNDGDVGYAVNCFDYKMIAKKIMDIYLDYDNISKRCIKYADEFNWKNIAIKYKEIYEIY